MVVKRRFQRLVRSVLVLMMLAACSGTASEPSMQAALDGGTGDSGVIDSGVSDVNGVEDTNRSEADVEADVVVAEPDPETQAAFEAALQAWSDAENSGLGAVVSYEGVTYVAGGWGMATETEPATEDVLFEVGSVTKMYTAALIHDAVERGEVAWDAPVSRYLPDFVLGDTITIERLVRQTTGIFNYTSSRDFQQRDDEAWSEEELRTLFESEPLKFEPGTAFAYSNSNYYLLGLVLESATNQPFEGLLQERIVHPLGLEKTGMCDVDSWTLPRAQGYGDSRFGRQKVASIDMSAPYSAGGICSTAHEVSAFANAFYNGRWFERELLGSPEVFDSGLPSPYSLATFVGRVAWQDTLSHGGNIPGFTALVMHWPEFELTAVLLTNLNSAPLSRAAEQLLSVLVEVDRPVYDVALTPEALADWSGTYNAPDLPPLEIRPRDGTLELFVQNTTFALKRVGEDDFETVPKLLRMRFLASGLLEIEQNGALLTLSKE